MRRPGCTPHNRTPPDVAARAVKLYQEGATTQEAATACGLARQTVRGILRAAGVKTRPAAHREAITAQLARGVRTCNVCKRERHLAEMVRSAYSLGYEALCRDCQSRRMGTANRQKPPELRLTETQRAYLAGLIDAEGCLTIVVPKKGATLHYQPRLTVGMTEPALAALCAETGAGRVSEKAKVPVGGTRPLFLWVVGAHGCRSLLPLVLPYLRVKRAQAEILLRFLALTATHEGRNGFEPHRALWEEVHALNANGPHGDDAEARARIAAVRASAQQVSGSQRRLSAVQLAYLAGLIDGDGHVGIGRSCQPSRGGKPFYYGRLSVSMKTPRVLDLLAETGMGTVGGRPSTAKRAFMYYWKLSGGACRRLLPRLLPFLRFKRRQAHILLEYLSLPRVKAVHRRRVRSLYRRMRAANSGR